MIIGLNNSSNITTILSYPWVSSLSNVSVAIGTIFLAILTYRSTIELKKQYKNSIMREKAMLINTKTIPLLKKKIEELCSYLGNDEFIKFEGGISNPVLKITPNCFIDIVRSENAFTVVNEEIYLIYTADDYFKNHMGSAVSSINMYHKNALELEKLVKSVFNSETPDSFIRHSKEIGLSEFGTDFTNTLRPIEDFLSIVYIVARTGSKNAYTNGSVNIINLIKRRYDELHSAALADPESKRISTEIQVKLRDINANISDAYDEIKKLEELWQNKFII